MSPEPSSEALITNDAVICGLLLGLIAVVFYTSSLNHPFWRRFYTFCPKLLLFYFLPGLMGTLDVFSAEESQLYFVASRYLLPSSLVLLTLSINVRELLRLGPKTILVFLAGTAGVVLGGPLVLVMIKTFFPSFVEQYSLHQIAGALSTLAGSWIGGGANQAAMKEIFNVRSDLYGIFLTVDALCASLLLMGLIIGAERKHFLDKWLNARSDRLSEIQARMIQRAPRTKEPISTSNICIVAAIGLSVTAVAHLCSDWIVPWLISFPELAQHSLTSPFFWIIITSTTLGILLSCTPLRKLEQKGTTEIGSAFLYFLIATIGMSIDLGAVFQHPEVFLVGGLWLMVHLICLWVAARCLRMPFFFLAVGSQANIGGAASAPVVASAFHPVFAPVGVLLAVLGYAVGTYAAYFCGLWMQWIAF